MLEERINSKFHDLNPTDLHLIEYILQHKSAVSGMTITRLSQATNISNTTIHRTIKKLGFEGYTEFRYVLKEEKEKQIEHENQTREEIKTRILNEAAVTIDRVDEDVLQGFMERMLSSKRIFTYATGWRHRRLMDIFRNELQTLQIHPISCSTTETFGINSLTSDDLVIILSLSGETPELKPVLQNLRLHNVPIVSITVATVNTLATNATYGFTYFDPYFETGANYVPWSSRNVYTLLEYLMIRLDQYVTSKDKK